MSSTTGKRTRGVTKTRRNVRRKTSNTGMAIPRGQPGMHTNELKCVDFAPTATTLNSTPQFNTVNLCVQGAGFYQRVGRKIKLKSLQVLLQIYPIRTIVADDYVRVMVIYDRQPNAAVPASLATVIQSTTVAGTASNTAYDFINQANRDRFHVFMDQRVTLPSITYNAGVITNVGLVDPEPEQSTFNINRFIKLKGFETVYNQTNGGTIADITSGALHVLTFGYNASGSEGYEAILTTRLRYYD